MVEVDRLECESRLRLTKYFDNLDWQPTVFRDRVHRHAHHFAAFHLGYQGAIPLCCANR